MRGSPYHPQSKGKVERSHRSLRKKISFDLLRFSKVGVGVNWASKLREYKKILNEEPMDVLGRQSPFEVFYCRESNTLTQTVEGGKTYKENSSSATNTNPKKSDYSKCADQSRRIRSKAITSDNVWDKRYISRKTKGAIPLPYTKLEKQYLLYPFSRKSRAAPRKRFAFEGKFLKGNLPTGKYKIPFESPKTQQPCTQWVSVEDITSLTARKEKRKKAAA